jgi:hypothetical protein
VHLRAPHRWICALGLLAGCAGAPRVEPKRSALPPAMQFEALVDQDPVAAAPYARAVLASPLTDHDTRARVLARWSAALPGLEALRDARIADAEAFLAQGAVAAATETVHEALAIERAVGAVASPRTAGQVARDVEAARLGAETTAAEAGQRARAAFRAEAWSDATEAAAEARRLRNRAGLPADVGLAVLEGLARRRAPAPEVDPSTVAQAPEPAEAAPPSVHRPAKRRQTSVAAPRPAAPVVTVAPPRNFVEEARRAQRQDDLAGLLGVLGEARAAGATDAELGALSAWAEAERARVVREALAAAEAAYVREDLERARAHWERVLALEPQNARAREGMAMYERFAALTRASR